MHRPKVHLMARQLDQLVAVVEGLPLEDVAVEAREEVPMLLLLPRRLLVPVRPPLQ